MSISANHTVTLVKDKLYALCNSYSVEGRVSTHPPGAKGYTCMNCYVLIENHEALLIDTGMSIHQTSIIEQLTALLGTSQALSILPFRFGEFNALSNARPIADYFPLRAVYGNALGEPSEWLDFRPGFPPGGGGLAGIASPAVRIDGDLPVDTAGHRKLSIIRPPVRLLPGLWAYDAMTRTLFTSDLFTWIWRRTDNGPWIVDEADEPTTSQVRDFLVDNRYWWLAGARTDRLRRDLAQVFEDHLIERIAPGYGCIIDGADAVARQYRMFDSILENFAREPATGVAAGSRFIRSLA